MKKYLVLCFRSKRFGVNTFEVVSKEEITATIEHYKTRYECISVLKIDEKSKIIPNFLK